MLAVAAAAGLLKVVAATETLAAGINMPARTTIIGSLSRRQSAGHALLKHNQLLQMAGRAGRRGFDIAGARCHLCRHRRPLPPQSPASRTLTVVHGWFLTLRCGTPRVD